MTDIEKVARAMAAQANDYDNGILQWECWCDSAQAAIAAMQPAPQEPVAWMYIRKPEEWPPARPVVQRTRWAMDNPARPFWIEHALGIIPTPPAGGSDAE